LADGPAAGLAGTLLLAAGAVCLTSGCSTLGYYAQAVQWPPGAAAKRAAGVRLDGRTRHARTAAPAPAAEPAPARLCQRRTEAARQRSYRRYADLHRSAAVWNVVAAPELSLTLKTWCFPVMGCVGYRGYYDRDRPMRWRRR
jgi:predicted aminopeptidase